MLRNAELTIRANSYWEYEYETSMFRRRLPEDKFTIKTESDLLYERDKLMERMWQLAASISKYSSRGLYKCEKFTINDNCPLADVTIKTVS